MNSPMMVAPAMMRRAVADGVLCLCTPYKPAAGFSAANAMVPEVARRGRDWILQLTSEIEGHPDNVKRVYRLYREEGLSLGLKRPRRNKAAKWRYMHGGQFKVRAAYRWACEVSVYLEMGRRRTGMGRALYQALFDRLPDLQVTGEPDRLRSSFVNGIKRLPVRLTGRT